MRLENAKVCGARWGGSLAVRAASVSYLTGRSDTCKHQNMLDSHCLRDRFQLDATRPGARLDTSCHPPSDIYDCSTGGPRVASLVQCQSAWYATPVLGCFSLSPPK